MAATVYASTVTISFKFNEHYYLSSVSTAIDSIPFLSERFLNISAALEIVGNAIFTSDRNNTPGVLVVFVSNILSGNFTEISQGLRDKGITIIVIGLGSGFYLNQLKVIASKPESDYVFTVLLERIGILEGAIAGAVSQGNFTIFLTIQNRV